MKKIVIAALFASMLFSNIDVVAQGQNEATNKINHITFQDKYIWIATAQGIHRISLLDKTNIITYPTFYYIRKIEYINNREYANWGLQFDYISDFIIDSKKNVWFYALMNGNLMRCEGNTFRIEKTFYNESGIGASIYFDGINYQNVKYSTRLVSINPKILINKNENLWFCSEGINKYDGLKWNFFSETNGLLSNSINAICFDKDNNIWCATDKGVSKFDGKEFINYTSANGLNDNKVFSIYNYTKNNIWCITKKGLSNFDGSNWKNYTTASGLISNKIITIRMDSVGRIWAVTNKGLSYLDDNKWISFTKDNGLLSDEISTIEVDNIGQMWVSTNNGLSNFNGSKWTSYTINNGLLSNDISAIAFDKNNNVWVATKTGMTFFNGNSWINYSFEEIFKGFNLVQFAKYTHISDLKINTDGLVWIGTNYGLFSFDGKKWEKLFLQDLENKYAKEYSK